MTIEEWQKSVDSWIRNYGVRYFDVQTNTLLLMEEVGEFTRFIAREYGEQSFKKPIDKKKVRENLIDEISDIIFVLTCISNQMDIDLTSALRKNLSKKTDRDNLRHAKNKKLQ